MKPIKIALLLADGGEEAEAVITADFLRRLQFDLTLLSIGDSPVVTGAHRITLKADRLLTACPDHEFNTVILPGGMPGATKLKDSPAVLRMVKAVHAAGGMVAAICAAPIVLEAAGILKGRRFTCYPGFEQECGSGKFTGATVEADGRIVTGRGPGAAFAFAARIAAGLGKAAEAEAQLKTMLVTE